MAMTVAITPMVSTYSASLMPRSSARSYTCRVSRPESFRTRWMTSTRTSGRSVSAVWVPRPRRARPRRATTPPFGPCKARSQLPRASPSRSRPEPRLSTTRPASRGVPRRADGRRRVRRGPGRGLRWCSRVSPVPAVACIGCLRLAAIATIPSFLDSHDVVCATELAGRPGAGTGAVFEPSLDQFRIHVLTRDRPQ